MLFVFMFCVLWQICFDYDNVRFSQGHVLNALGVTEGWYQECNEMLSLVIMYGEQGERWESPHAQYQEIPSQLASASEC